MKKVVVLCMAALPALPAAAQKRMSYGIAVGLHQSRLNAGSFDAATIKHVSTVDGPGFRLGLSAEYAITKHWSVTARPELAFYDSKAEVIKQDNTSTLYEMAPVAELSATIKYKIVKWPLRPYVFLGPGYTVPLTDNTTNTPRLINAFISVEAGIGLEKAFARFKIAPELRYSYGLTSVANIAGVNDLKMNVLSLILNFKG